MSIAVIGGMKRLEARYREVLQAAHRHRIPLYQFHSCGLCTLRDCLTCLRGSGADNHPSG